MLVGERSAKIKENRGTMAGANSGSWPNHSDLPPWPKLWDPQTLQALGLVTIVSFGFIAYVLLFVVKKQKVKSGRGAVIKKKEE